MTHPRLRPLASFIVLASVFIAGLGHAWANEPEPQFHASSFVINSSGNPDLFILKEPADCAYQASGVGSVLIGLPIAVARGNPNLGDDSFKEDLYVYQRLANGSLQQVPFSLPIFETPITDTNWFDTFGSTSMHPAGPDYVIAARATWLNGNFTRGSLTLGWSVYHRTVDGANPIDMLICSSPWGPFATTSASSGIVNSTLYYQLYRYPLFVSVPITWDGKVIGTASTTGSAQAIGKFQVPAAPMGPHTIRWNYGHWQTSKVFTVKPRIKLVPSTNLHRGDTVNVSLRGYKAGEVVRIRWKKADGTWVEIARVTTSSTGSKNINVRVPSFAPNGPNSVRGDSVNTTGGHAQTNAVNVVSSSTSGAAAKPSATPAPTKTATATPMPISPTLTTVPSATATPTEVLSTLTSAPTETLAPVPTDSATPTAELTAVLTETPVATTTED